MLRERFVGAKTWIDEGNCNDITNSQANFTTDPT
jgi:hypothetical protein